MPGWTPTPEQEIAQFIATRLDELEKQAVAMREISVSGQWEGIDPADVAANLEQTVTAGRRALRLFEFGKVGVLALKLWAFNFARHPDFREEWRP